MHLYTLQQGVCTCTHMYLNTILVITDLTFTRCYFFFLAACHMPCCMHHVLACHIIHGTVACRMDVLIYRCSKWCFSDALRRGIVFYKGDGDGDGRWSESPTPT